MKFFLTSIFFLLNILTSQATHFFATDLSYQCLGNNQYQVTLRLYSDCSGTPPPTTATVELSSMSCGQTATSITLYEDTNRSGAETTPLCATYSNLSACKGGSIPAEQESIYTGIITLSQACPDWIISHSYVRSSYFTNINNPGSTNTYIETSLNNTNGACYNSPQFTDYPMHYACAGQRYEGNLGARDIDGDTLVYTLMAPATSASSQASFVSGLSANNPMQLVSGSSFNFNTYTGDFSFTPQGGSSQFVVLAIRIEKIYNGQIVASSMQEIDIVITSSCNNSSIQLLDQSVTMGMYSDDTTKYLDVCNSSTVIAMSFEFFNPNGDSILFYAKQSNLAAVFGAGNYSATFNYLNNRPDSARLDILAANFTSAQPQFLSVAVRNKACVMESRRKFTYLLKPVVQLTSQSTPASSAASSDGSANILITQGQSPFTYLWNTGATTASLSNLTPATYWITVTDNNNCTVMDSVVVNFLTTTSTIAPQHKYIHVYPNPAKDYCTIDLPFLQGSAIQLNLVNSLGQTLLQEEIKLSGQSTYQLNTQDYPKGLYWLKIHSKHEEHWTTPLIIK